MKWLGQIAAINFTVAVVVLVGGCFLSLTEASVFEFNDDLYDALDNNLRWMLVNLGMTELVVLLYCWFTRKFQYMLLVGLFLLLMIVSVQVYGQINSIQVDANFSVFFAYTGLSHILFGWLTISANKMRTQE